MDVTDTPLNFLGRTRFVALEITEEKNIHLWLILVPNYCYNFKTSEGPIYTEQSYGFLVQTLDGGQLDRQPKSSQQSCFFETKINLSLLTKLNYDVSLLWIEVPCGSFPYARTHTHTPHWRLQRLSLALGKNDLGSTLRQTTVNSESRPDLIPPDLLPTRDLLHNNIPLLFPLQLGHNFHGVELFGGTCSYKRSRRFSQDRNPRSPLFSVNNVCLQGQIKARF